MNWKKHTPKLLTAVLAVILAAVTLTPSASAATVSFTMSDVMGVVNTISGYLIVIGAALVLMVLALIFAGKAGKPLSGLIRGSSVVAAVLVIALIVNMICFGPYYNTISAAMTEVGSLSDETKENSRSNIIAVAEEGIVLAKNADNALPLTNTAKLNVFGWASTNPIYGGTGSGSVDLSTATSLLGGLEQAGFELNTELSDFYTSYCDTRPNIGMSQQDWTLPEPNVADYSDSMIANAKGFSDTAVVVFGRSGGEGADIPHDMQKVLAGEWVMSNNDNVGSYDDSLNKGNDWNDGDTYLQLNNREKDLLDMVCSNFDKVVVIVNSSNAIQMDWVNDYAQVKGILLCPGPGTYGFIALGEILKGTVNPSGHTVDTYVADLTATPTFNNFGCFYYTNNQAMEAAIGAAEQIAWNKATSFVNYVEGIYVGYKYYETAYTEAQENGYDFDYDSMVVYPFGYGLSYTTFKQEMGPVSESNGTISFDVTVTNTGNTAGKDVVEVYYNPPYTNGGIEKASVNLVAFAKTKLLEPNASETVKISFAVEDMASYDDQEIKAAGGGYVLEAGEYTISIRSDSHTVLDEQTYTVSKDVSYTDGQDGARSSDFTTAVNQFNSAGDVTYLSRADGFANYAAATAGPTSYEMSATAQATYLGNGTYNPADYNDPNDVMPTQGKDSGLKLHELRGADYDDSRWETLLDELSVDDMKTLIGYCGYQTPEITSIGKIATIDADGPAGVNSFFNGCFGTGFCTEVMLANTWNTELAEEMGEYIGAEANDFGVSGWYGPAMNTHRSAFAGRTFEYYSEDSVLAGYMAAAEVKGAASKGVYAYLKHFVVNDQDTNRGEMICVWTSEQSLREIYLKPFEMGVKANAGSPLAMMTSYGFIGTEPSMCNNALLNLVLRGEWGFRGFCETDYFAGLGFMDADRMIRGGNDAMLATIGGEAMVDDNSATSVIAMRQASKNILYTVVNSSAYENYQAGGSMAAWQVAFIAADVVVVLLMAAIEIMLVRNYLKKKKAA